MSERESAQFSDSTNQILRALDGETVTRNPAFSATTNAILDAIEDGGGGLPAVTSADNGKVLGVVNGAWDKTEDDYVVQISTLSGGYVSNRSASQIYQAVQDGKRCYAIVDGFEVAGFLNLYTVQAPYGGYRSDIGAFFTINVKAADPQGGTDARVSFASIGVSDTEIIGSGYYVAQIYKESIDAERVKTLVAEFNIDYIQGTATCNRSYDEMYAALQKTRWKQLIGVDQNDKLYYVCDRDPDKIVFQSQPLITSYAVFTDKIEVRSNGVTYFLLAMENPLPSFTTHTETQFLVIPPNDLAPSWQIPAFDFAPEERVNTFDSTESAQFLQFFALLEAQASAATNGYASAYMPDAGASPLLAWALQANANGVSNVKLVVQNGGDDIVLNMESVVLNSHATFVTNIFDTTSTNIASYQIRFTATSSHFILECQAHTVPPFSV